MAYGRVSVVLGVQQGLGAILQLLRGEQSKTAEADALQGLSKHRYTDAEIATILHQLVGLDRYLRREEIDVQWAIFGGSARTELPQLFKHFQSEIESESMLAIEDLQGIQCDALVYIPLDVQQPKQVEQLARLSMMAPRVRHVAFAPLPRWNHAQLMALREIWQWTDPRHQGKVLGFAEEVIRVNGGLTRRDLEKVDLPQNRKDESFDPVILTRSPRMKELLNLIDTVADTDSTILITGSSGTGKELVAQRIHARSHRRNNELMAVNCGAIPSELLESELFGHMKGAFTGAVNNREGRFQAAEKGTLFLDEIGEMGANLQVKLLRVLQTRKFEPVGSTKSRNADVRIVAATNRDLELETKEGRFREDLFYRLNVIPIHVPSLKERKEDIQILVEFFIRKFNQEKSRRVTGVTRASLRALVAYDWPGNVRELENLMERMVILKSSGMIDVLDFPEKYRRLSLSEIEFEDLMNAAKLQPGSAGSSQSAASGVGSAAISTSVSTLGTSEDHFITGGEAMKNFGTFTKGIIEQSANGGTIENSIENAASLAPESMNDKQLDVEGSISIEQAIRLIADKVVFPVDGLDFNSVVDQFENILILQALERTGWNRNRAAGLLRLNRTTLVEKLKKKQLMPPLRGEDSLLGGNA